MSGSGNISNVFLDWSGTVVDDLPPVIDATNRVMEYYHKPAYSREKFCREFRLPFKEFYDRVLPGVAMDELDSLYTRFFDESEKQATELPGARVFLDYCIKTGRRIFLLSSIKKHHFEAQAKQLGLRQYFEHAYTEILNKKESITGILQELGIASDAALFAGDMQHDIDTARHAGLLAVATLTGYNNREQLIASSPDMIVDNLSELIGQI